MQSIIKKKMFEAFIFGKGALFSIKVVVNREIKTSREFTKNTMPLTSPLKVKFIRYYRSF